MNFEIKLKELIPRVGIQAARPGPISFSPNRAGPIITEPGWKNEPDPGRFNETSKNLSFLTGNESSKIIVLKSGLPEKPSPMTLSPIPTVPITSSPIPEPAARKSG